MTDSPLPSNPIRYFKFCGLCGKAKDKESEKVMELLERERIGLALCNCPECYNKIKINILKELKNEKKNK